MPRNYKPHEKIYNSNLRTSFSNGLICWMNDIDKTVWGTGKTWKSTSFWRRVNDNRRVNEWNEFLEWHVAWLAEWHNYVECNTYRMTQRNKFNSKAALFLEPIWKSSKCVIRLISIGLSTGSTNDHKCTEETFSSSVYGGGYSWLHQIKSKSKAGVASLFHRQSSEETTLNNDTVLTFSFTYRINIYLDWKRSFGCLESWKGLLFVTNVSKRQTQKPVLLNHPDDLFRSRCYSWVQTIFL